MSKEEKLKNPSLITSDDFLAGDRKTVSYVYELLYTFLKSKYPVQYLQSEQVIVDIIMSTISNEYARLKFENKFEDSEIFKMRLLRSSQALMSNYIHTKKEELRPSQQLDLMPTITPDSSNEGFSEEDIERLKEALSLLSPADKSIIDLIYIRGYSIEEAANELKINPSTLRNQKSKALSNLKKLWEKTA